MRLSPGRAKKRARRGVWVARASAEDSTLLPGRGRPVRHRQGKYVKQMTFIDMQKGPRPVVGFGPFELAGPGVSRVRCRGWSCPEC